MQVLIYAIYTQIYRFNIREIQSIILDRLNSLFVSGWTFETDELLCNSWHLREISTETREG